MARVNSFCQKLALSDEKFEALSLQAERELNDNRSFYMFKVMALATLGYAFIFLVVALLIMGAIWLIQALIYSHLNGGAFKLLLLFLIPLYVIGKSLSVKIPEPTGVTVTRSEAPEFFKLLDELSGKLNTRVDKVLLDGQYNAAVIQIPRLGFLGFYKNVVMVGMPLMLTQRPEQIKAVLAHELGHLSGNHSKSSAWIYKLRSRWANLLSTINQAGNLFFALFLIFFSWFSPRFNAYSLALARAHELEADANAARIAGAENFTKSMLALPVYGKFLGQTFWPGVKEMIKTSKTAPEDVFIRLQDQTANYTPNKDELEQTIKEAMEEKGSGTDTHPPLRVRLLEGHFDPVLPQGEETDIPQDMMAEIARPLATKDSAAYQYLGPAMERALTQLGLQWQRDMGPGWKQQYDRQQQLIEALGQLDQKAEGSPLSIEELKLKAYLVGETQNQKACIAVYNDILKLSPDEFFVKFKLGMLLLEDNMDEGLKHVQIATTARSSFLPQACPSLLPLLKQSGRYKEAAELEHRLEKYKKEAALAQKERLNVNGESMLEPHGLQDADLQYLDKIFAQIPQIKEAYVVRRFVRYLPDCPYLVIGLEIKPKASGSKGVFEKSNIAQWLIANLQLPYEFCVSTFDMHTVKLKRNIIAMDDALVHRK